MSIAALELDIDYGDGPEVARFEMGPIGSNESPAIVEDEMRTDILKDSLLDDLVAALFEVAGEEGNKDISFNFGQGQHVVTIQAESPGATEKPDGTLFQWGTSADPAVGPNEKTATGAEPEKQQAVLMHALRLASPDSITPARLEVGEYRPDGILPDDHLDVFLENPTTSLGSDAPARFDYSITCVETADLTDISDAANKLE